MTEFITRCCRAEKRYEIIINTDSEEYYKATQDFARKLIDHAKPMTNADRIRAMSDEELAKQLDYELGCPTTGDCAKMAKDCKACWLDWLQQPAEGE